MTDGTQQASARGSMIEPNCRTSDRDQSCSLVDPQGNLDPHRARLYLNACAATLVLTLKQTPKDGRRDRS